MRIFIWITLLIPFSLCGQVLSTITTHKAINAKQFVKESLYFAYMFEEEIFYIKDNDSGSLSSYKNVEFYDEDFDDGGYYTLTFSSNLASHILKGNEKGGIGVFAVFFDKKGGTILGVRVHKLNQQVQIYLTDEGIKKFTSG